MANEDDENYYAFPQTMPKKISEDKFFIRVFIILAFLMLANFSLFRLISISSEQLLRCDDSPDVFVCCYRGAKEPELDVSSVSVSEITGIREKSKVFPAVF